MRTEPSVRWGLAALAAASLAGCVVHTDRTHEWIRESASRDLACPKGKLTITHYTRTSKKKKAVGCGKRAIYVEVCRGSECRWRRRGPVESAR